MPFAHIDKEDFSRKKGVCQLFSRNFAIIWEKIALFADFTRANLFQRAFCISPQTLRAQTIDFFLPFRYNNRVVLKGRFKRGKSYEQVRFIMAIRARKLRRNARSHVPANRTNRGRAARSFLFNV